MQTQMKPQTMPGAAGQDRQAAPKSGRRRLILACILAAVLALTTFLLPGLMSSSKQTSAPKVHSVPVTVARATQQAVPIEIHTIGNVLPYSVVNVVPQVSGQLKNVYFSQGQMVKKGQPLFEIDPSQYNASVAQAEGVVAKDRAQIGQAEANLLKDQAAIGQLQADLKKDQASAGYAQVESSRYGNLLNQGAVSKEQSEQMMTNSATANATVQADLMGIKNAQAVVQSDRAAIDSAKGTLAADQGAAQNVELQLNWTTIRSPIDGKTGSLNVYQGNVVTANSGTPLVTIDQITPIYINFTVPETYLNDVRSNLANHTLKVEALIEGSKTNAVEGTVSFLQNTVDTSSGTVTLRATFANTDSKLFPGQFVDVIVSMPPSGASVVVPSEAVQNTQQGSAVYVVNGDDTVQCVAVTVLRTQGDLTALGSGLSAGDLVVTDGQLQLVPGARVQIVKDRSSVPGGDAGTLPGDGT